MAYRLNQTMVKNALALYGVKGLEVALPLITTPFLARVLEPNQWGILLLVQTILSWLNLVVAYGFDFSASRSLASDSSRGEAIAAGILGAKAILIGLSLLILLILGWSIPILSDSGALLASAGLLIVVSGLSSLWYFIGLEQANRIVGITLLGRTMSTFAVFVLVRYPSDGWLVLIAQALGLLMVQVYGLGLMYRHLRFRLPRKSETLQALKDGFQIFAANSVSSWVVGLPVLLLGIWVTPVMVGFYGGADRIVKMVSGVVAMPLVQLVHPRVANLRANNRIQGDRMAYLGLIGVGLVTSGIAVLVALLAHPIVIMFLGRDYEATIPVLRLLSPLILLFSVNGLLWTLWILPMGKWPIMLWMVALECAAFVFLSLPLIQHWGLEGMAILAVATQAITVSTYLLIVLKNFRLRVLPDLMK